MAQPNEEVIITASYSRPEIIRHPDAYPNAKGVFAMELASRIAVALAEPDGEDSSGRQKWKVMDSSQVSKRACDIAEEIFSEMDSRNWFIPMPKWEEIKKLHAEAKKLRDLER